MALENQKTATSVADGTKRGELDFYARPGAMTSAIKDVAALNKMETLPWDVWGAMTRPGETLGAEQLAFFDRLAELTRAPDTSFAELRALYEGDERLRVPGTVFNAVLNRAEAL